MADTAAEPKKKGFKDINFASRKFLLSVAAIAMIAYGMYYGHLPWKHGANLIAFVVSIYCLAEGVADHGGRGQLEKILALVIGKAGTLFAPNLAVPKPSGKKPPS